MRKKSSQRYFVIPSVTRDLTIDERFTISLDKSRDSSLCSE